MDKFELLGIALTDVCKDRNIKFKWRYNDMFGNYTLKFKKSGKQINIIISEKDLYIKPFNVIKTEVEHAIFELDKEAS